MATVDLVWTNYLIAGGGSLGPAVVVGADPWTDDSQSTYTDYVIRTAGGASSVTPPSGVHYVYGHATLPPGFPPGLTYLDITSISGVIESRMQNEENADGNGDLRGGVTFYSYPTFGEYLGNLGTSGDGSYVINDAEDTIETHALTDWHDQYGAYGVTGSLFNSLLEFGGLIVMPERYTTFGEAIPSTYRLRTYKLILTITYNGPPTSLLRRAQSNFVAS
jgi:hypothetical protein